MANGRWRRLPALRPVRTTRRDANGAEVGRKEGREKAVDNELEPQASKQAAPGIQTDGQASASASRVCQLDRVLDK